MELSHPLQLTDNAAAQQGNDNSPISIGNIQKILGIVKKKNYYQQAEGVGLQYMCYTLKHKKRDTLVI